MKKITKIGILSIIAGILYHLGGLGGAWWKNTKVRDLGVAFVAMITMLFLGAKFSLALIVSTLLLFGSLTTYWKKISKWIGKPTNKAYWWNWLATGFVYGLAYLPMVFAGISLYSILGRAIILSITTMLWSVWINKAWLEEFGRGVLIIITLLLL